MLVVVVLLDTLIKITLIEITYNRRNRNHGHDKFSLCLLTTHKILNFIVLISNGHLMFKFFQRTRPLAGLETSEKEETQWLKRVILHILIESFCY